MASILFLVNHPEAYVNHRNYFEEKGFEVISSEVQHIPTTTKELNDEQVDEVLKLIDKLEEDDDVQNVFHNLA